MGIYVNPRNTAFRKALNSDIYVDKTELISVTNARIDKSNCFMWFGWFIGGTFDPSIYVETFLEETRKVLGNF